MSKLIIPKKKKLDDVEKIALPHVKCDKCGNWTTTGLHQKQLVMVEPGKTIKMNGTWKYIPAVMKQVDVYMCTTCVARGEKWPGENPR